MAKTILFTLQVDGTTTAITNQNELKKAIKAVKKELEGVPIGSKEYEALNKTVAKGTQLQKDLRKSTRDAQRELVAAGETSAGAYSKLSAQLNISRTRLKNLAAEGKTNTGAFKKLRKEVEGLDKQLKEIDASAGQFQRNVGNYPKTFAAAGKSILAAFGIAGGVSIITTAIRNIAKESLELANQAAGVDFAFRNIAGSAVILQQAREATRGLLSDLELKKSIVEFDNFGIELKQLPELLEFVSVRAAQTGKSFDTLRDSLIEGLSKESKLRIDNLGISTKELNDELEKAPSFVQAVANIAKREIAEAGNVIDAAANKQQQFNVAMENAKTALGVSLKGALDSVLPSITSLVNSFAEILEQPVDQKINDERIALNNLIGAITDVNTEEEERGRLIDRLQAEYPDFLGNLDAEKVTNEELVGNLKDVNEQYILRAKLALNAEKIAEATRAIAEAENELVEAQIRSQSIDSGTTSRALGNQLGGAVVNDADNIRGRQRAGNQTLISGLRATIDENRELLESLTEVQGKLKEISGDGTGSGTGGGGGDTGNTNDSLANLRQTVKDLKEELEGLTIGSSDYLKTKKELDTASARLKSLTEKETETTKKQRTEIEKLNDEIKKLESTRDDQVLEGLIDKAIGTQQEIDVKKQQLKDINDTIKQIALNSQAIDSTIISESGAGGTIENDNSRDEAALKKAELDEIEQLTKDSADRVADAQEDAARRALETQEMINGAVSSGIENTASALVGLFGDQEASLEDFGRAAVGTVLDTLEAIIRANAISALAVEVGTKGLFGLPQGLIAQGLVLGLISGLRGIIAEDGVTIDRGGRIDERGVIRGRRHSQGGVDMTINGRNVNAEDGELVERHPDGAIQIHSRQDTNRLLQNISPPERYAGSLYARDGVIVASGGGISAGQVASIVRGTIEQMTPTIHSAVYAGASGGSREGTGIGISEANRQAAQASEIANRQKL